MDPASKPGGTMMAFELLTRVTLPADFLRHQLHHGDVATIVEHHPVAPGEEGYSLAVFDAIGETIAVLVVSAAQMKPLMKNEVLHLRGLDQAV
jgi:hypothetical protein